MTDTSAPSRAVLALVTGTATAAYYASPDFLASRTTRGWVKTGLSAVIAAAVAHPGFRAAARERGEHGGEPVSTGMASPLSSTSKVAVYGTGAAILIGAVGAGVAMERWIFRRGQAQAGAGVRLPHTRAALLYGALAAVLSLIPAPPVPTELEMRA